jgi:hypothetical protein
MIADWLPGLKRFFKAVLPSNAARLPAMRVVAALGPAKKQLSHFAFSF